MYVVEHASRHQQKRQCVMLRRLVLLGRSIALIVVLICDGVIVAFLVQRSVAQSLLVKITYLEKLDPEYEDASMKTEALKIFQSTKRSAYFVIV